MFFKKRKRELSNKLREMNFPEDQIKLLIKLNYNFYSILQGFHIKLEIDVNDRYYLLQRELVNTEKYKLKNNEKFTYYN